MTLLPLTSGALQNAQAPEGNRPERLEWFRDAGFGLMISWSLESSLGSVIGHSLVGASDDYLRRFFELPPTFHPKRFDPHDWAVLAKLAGIRYMVFTAKCHCGFCMFDTATTNFSVMGTPYGRDITAQIVTAFREQGIAPGLYFSPDDFHLLWKQGKVIDRSRLDVLPPGNPPLMKLAQAQLRELLSNYGPIAVMFLDGPVRVKGRGVEELRDASWKLQPDIVVTRGAIETPEQYIPGMPMDKPWEACLTMGTEWPYKPTNEVYKTGTQLIETLIETRAKGGNLLLNVGPKPDGELPIEQEALLREIALWSFVNGESIYGVRPWVVTNERNIWFTRKKNTDTVYAFVTGPRWKFGERREFTLQSVAATSDTTVSVLGQSGEVLEYQPSVIPRAKWRQDEKGLHITAMHAQRLYNDMKWPNAIVMKITHVKPGMTPPQVSTEDATWELKTGTAVLHGNLKHLGKASSVEVGFQYRPSKGTTDFYEKTEPWHEVKYESRTAPGPYSMRVSGLERGQSYEYRAAVKHPLITIYGQEKTIARADVSVR